MSCWDVWPTHTIGMLILNGVNQWLNVEWFSCCCYCCRVVVGAVIIVSMGEGGVCCRCVGNVDVGEGKNASKSERVLFVLRLSMWHGGSLVLMGSLSMRWLMEASAVAVRATSMLVEAASKSERVWGLFVLSIGLFVDLGVGLCWRVLWGNGFWYNSLVSGP
eukprot:scaffold248340_cov40-Cyclotella_meneghiniana.AAC.1